MLPHKITAAVRYTILPYFFSRIARAAKKRQNFFVFLPVAGTFPHAAL